MPSAMTSILLLLSPVLLARIAPTTSDGAIRHASVGETLTLEHVFGDLVPANASRVNVTVGWAALFAGARAARRLDVCLLHRKCEPNIVLHEADSDAGVGDVARAGVPMALLTATLTGEGRVGSVLNAAVLAPNVTAHVRNRTVVLRVPLTTPGNWIYFFDARNGTGGAAHETVAVAVAPAGRPARVTGSPRTPTTTHEPITPLRVEAHFSTGGPHTRLFSPGDTFFVNLTLRSQIHDPSAFTASLEWYRVYPGDACAVFTVYEPCLFHPNAPACLHPADPECAFASPYLAETLFSRLYVQCRARHSRWTADCSGTVYEHPSPYLAQADNRVDLFFRRTPAEASAIYLFVLRYRGHIETWTYVDVTTAARLTNIEVAHRLPARASDGATTGAPPPPRPDRPVGVGEGGAAGGWSGGVVVGLSLASIVSCFAAVGLCALCVRVCWKRRCVWRCPRRAGYFAWVRDKGRKTRGPCSQKRSSRPKPEVVYTQLPVTERGDAVGDSGSESDDVYTRDAPGSRSTFTFGTAGSGGSFADYRLVDG